MKLQNTETEAEYRQELLLSNKYLYETEKGQHALDAVRKICGVVKTAYVLAHTPEQGEDVFRIIVNGEKVVGFDLQDEDGNYAALNVSEHTVKAYERLLTGGSAKMKLTIATALAKSKMLAHGSSLEK
jgi:hypothetical protein